jgi:putative ABC transport system permease protein
MTPAGAVGQRLQLEEERLEIVGVARNSKYDEAAEDPRPFLYTSIAQQAHLDRETLIVRTAGAAEAAIPLVQAQIRALDPAMPVFDVRTMQGVLRERSDKQRGVSTMLAAFGILALGLAAIGLYGVISYTVTLRTRELGVRLALGASPRELTRLVASEGLRLALAGAAIGSLLSLPVAYILGAVIFGVRVGDLAGFTAACGLLVAVAVSASLVPAWRASRLDPMAALRTE